MEAYLTTLLRILVTWPLLYFLTIVMGRRDMGQLPVYDFIIVITIGSIVATDLADPSVPHGPILMTIIILALLQIGFTKLQVKSAFVRSMSNITPTIIIQNGQFLTHNMAKVRYTVDDVLPFLRMQGVFNLSEVEYAIIEPNGNISVLKKANFLPVSPLDMGLDLPNKGLPRLFVADGKLVPNAFKDSGVDQAWLETQIRSRGFKDIKEIYLAALEHNGNLYISPMRVEKIGRSIHY